MIVDIDPLYRKHSILIKKFSMDTFIPKYFNRICFIANIEGIKNKNMALFVPERLTFYFGTALGKFFNITNQPHPIETVQTGYIGQIFSVSMYTDIFSSSKLKEKEQLELRGF